MPGERGGAEAEEGDELEREQDVLDDRGELEAAVRDDGDGPDEQRRGDGDRGLVGGQ